MALRRRIVTKVGDIFEVPLDDQGKKYMQYIATDQTQLTSSVIRAFKTKYPLDALPTADDIAKDAVDFYAHTILRQGILQNIWKKVGKSADLGSLNVWFRGTNDVMDPKIKVSKNWHVWRINGPRQKVGELLGEYQKAEIGSVMIATDIVDRMKTGKYGFVYPSY